MSRFRKDLDALDRATRAVQRNPAGDPHAYADGHPVRVGDRVMVTRGDHSGRITRVDGLTRTAAGWPAVFLRGGGLLGTDEIEFAGFRSPAGTKRAAAPRRNPSDGAYGRCPTCKKYVAVDQADRFVDHNRDGAEVSESAPRYSGGGDGDCRGGGTVADEVYGARFKGAGVRRNPASRQRLAVAGWRVTEQVPSGAWRHAIEAPRYFKTREEADEAADRLRAKYVRLGHNHPIDVEFIADTARNPAKGRDWDAVERRIEQMVSDVTDEAHRLVMSGVPDGVYLYVVPSTATEWGQLVALPYAVAPPTRAELVLQQRLPQNKDRTGLRAFIRAKIGRLPLLPSGDA